MIFSPSSSSSLSPLRESSEFKMCGVTVARACARFDFLSKTLLEYSTLAAGKRDFPTRASDAAGVALDAATVASGVSRLRSETLSGCSYQNKFSRLLAYFWAAAAASRASALLSTAENNG